MIITQEEILRTAGEWLDAGRGVALATVVRTWGSSPRPVGSHLVADIDGHFIGSVSGGCIEGAVIQEARAALADGRVRLLNFGINDERAWEVGLTCGGCVQVLVQPLPALIHSVIGALAARRPAATVTRLSDGGMGFWLDGEWQDGGGFLGGAEAEIKDALLAHRSGPLSSDEGLFLRVYSPAPRLLVVGAVHIAQALAPMAAQSGFDVTLIDPRRAFASEDRFPGIKLLQDWPDRAMEILCPDIMTAVVTLTHDPKLDDPALAAALHSQAFYVGALGSLRTHAKRLVRLREGDFDEDNLARIHAPVGLDLGGKMPAEIAVSILAEILHVKYKGEK